MNGINKILIATDLHPLSNTALEKGGKLAKALKAELVIYHVLAKEGFFDRLPLSVLPPAQKYLIKTREYVTDQINKQLQKLKLDRNKVSIVIVNGDRPEVKILNYAKKNNVDLIILGAHGRYTLHDWFVGTTAEAIVKKATCSVSIIKKRKSNYKNILLPVDFSKASQKTIELAVALFPDSKFKALYVADQAYEDLMKAEYLHHLTKGKKLQTEVSQLLQDKLKRFCADAIHHKVAITYKVVFGHPGMTIIKEANTARVGLVMIGAYGHSQSYYKWLGSVANRVLVEVDTDLLLVPIRKTKVKKSQSQKEDRYIKNITKLTEEHFAQLKEIAKK